MKYEDDASDASPTAALRLEWGKSLLVVGGRRIIIIIILKKWWMHSDWKSKGPPFKNTFRHLALAFVQTSSESPRRSVKTKERVNIQTLRADQCSPFN